MTATTGRPPTRSALLLWLLAPALLWLSAHRPYGPSQGRAEGLRRSIPGFERVRLDDDPAWKSQRERFTPAEFRRLLGTADAAWEKYLEESTGAAMFMTAVFHGQNWRAVHPPHICLEGSNLSIVEDGELPVEIDGERVAAGRILLYSERARRYYLSVYVFVADGLKTGSYARFLAHHAPRALVRSSTRGFLLRVETYVGGDGLEAAESRCRRFLETMLPRAEARLARGE